MKCYGVTDKGLVRNNNQDSYIIASNAQNDILAIICDGIGGAKAGDVASKMATDYLSEVFSNNDSFIDLLQAKEFLKYHINTINNLIYNKSSQEEKYHGMGTTLTGVCITKYGSFTINVGDSRVYGLINNKLEQLTSDHTWVMEMVKAGQLTLQQARNHPKKNVITNAIGVFSSLRIDIVDIVNDYNMFLICSDGLYGYVNINIINDIVIDNISNQSKLRQLLAVALKAGGYDNISIILIDTKDKGE